MGAILRILDGVLAGLLVFSLAIALGGIVPALDVLSTVSIPIVIGGLALGVAAAARRSAARVAVAAAICLLPTHLVGPELIGRLRQAIGPAAITGHRIEVVTFNMMDGNEEQARIATFLRAEGPDIIVLQEAREEVVAALTQALPDYQTRVSCRDYPYCGLLIMSRWPGTLLPHGFWADDGLRGRSWGEPRLRYADVTLLLDGAIELDIAAVHVERRGRLQFDRTQLASLADFTRQLPHARRAILAGDFNTAAPSHALQALDNSTMLRRQTFVLPSWPADGRVGGALIAIDHVYAGQDIRLVRIRRGPNLGSDHFPIIAEFDVR